MVYFEQTDSTNLRIKELAKAGAPHGTLVAADMQTAGRGRRGHVWVSPCGDNIYMSLLLRPEISPDRASMLTLVAALSMADGIRSCTEEKIRVQIKWPNDLVINGRKAAGILTEMSVGTAGIRYVVVGMGINVNQTVFSRDIAETATSVRLETGSDTDCAQLIAAILENMENNYELFLKTEDLSGLMERYSALLITRERDVTVLGENGSYKAYAEGIDPEGRLIVITEDGRRKKICAGEVSVRGICGYV